MGEICNNFGQTHQLWDLHTFDNIGLQPKAESLFRKDHPRQLSYLLYSQHFRPCKSFFINSDAFTQNVSLVLDGPKC